MNRPQIYSLLKQLFTTPNKRTVSSLPQLISEVKDNNSKTQEPEVVFVKTPKGPSILEPCPEEDVSHIAPYLKPTYNFAAYVNKSETLQDLLKLGVDLHKLEKKAKVPEFILGLKFETDIKEHVIYLHELGLSIEDVGALITKNPFIFKETLENLSVRINYLESKQFTRDMIVRIISVNPYWLSFSTRDIDKRLGYFQKTFSLTGNEVRNLTAKQPRLITYSQGHIRKNLFVIKEEMGFNHDEYKTILLDKPRVFMNEPAKLLKIFEYLHRTMQIPLEMIAQMPDVLTCRAFRLQQRHEYLQKLGKVQFNPKEPGYISPLLIVSGTDPEFCTNVAKTSIESFNTFLKTL